MGSGLIALQEPPGRQRTEFGRPRTGDGERKRWVSVVCRPSSDVRSKQNWFSRLSDGKTKDRRTIRPLSSVIRRLQRRLGDESNQVERAISTGQLRALPRFHIRPINVVVFHGSSGRTGFEA